MSKMNVLKVSAFLVCAAFGGVALADEAMDAGAAPQQQMQPADAAKVDDAAKAADAAKDDAAKHEDKAAAAADENKAAE